MLHILGPQKSALMMVEPPGQSGRGRILEIDNHILVAIKYSALKRVRCFVRHPSVQEFGFRMNTLAVKARENSSRRRAIEAFIVEADSNVQFPLPPLAYRQTSLRGKSIKMDAPYALVKRQAGRKETRNRFRRCACPETNLGFSEEFVREIGCHRHAETLPLEGFYHANNPQDQTHELQQVIECEAE